MRRGIVTFGPLLRLAPPLLFATGVLYLALAPNPWLLHEPPWAHQPTSASATLTHAAPVAQPHPEVTHREKPCHKLTAPLAGLVSR